MSGGQLVVLDHSGRDVKRYPLAHGLVKLGSDESSDIRIMLDTVHPHHATVVVHTNQVVVRNVCEGELLVNGAAVSVAALRHGDVLSLGGRALRWEYLQPALRRPQAPQPAVYAPVRKPRRRGRASCPGGAGGGAGAGGAARRDRAVEYALEMRHRASMPASAGGKQVAIVQPQRRDTHELNEKPAPRTPVPSNKRPRTSRSDLDVSVSDADADKAKRRSTLQNTTKATLWIESRKSSPRNSNKVQTPPLTPPRSPPQTQLKSPPKSSPRTLPRTTARTPAKMRRSATSTRKSTPLRLTVLKRAQSAQAGRVTKIEAPTKIDHTKQAALLLMTGHTPKSRLFNSLSPNTSKAITVHTSRKSASPKITPLVTKKGSLVVKKTPRIGRAVSASPNYRPVSKSQGRRSLRKLSNRSNQKSFEKSPLLPNPKKSALRNPLKKKSMRKTESIKFDLSNLEGYSQDSDVLLLTDTERTKANESENEFPLRYSSSILQSPSPRRSIHSRSSKMLEKTLGSTITLSPSSSKNLTSESRSRKTSRGSLMLQNVLNKSDEIRSYSSRTTKTFSDISDDTVASAFRTRTLSPRTPQNNLESYSIVDLVSVDSNESDLSSVYNSAGSTSSAAFATPQNSVGKKTRSTIDPTLLGSSTPYVKVMRMSNTSSNVTLTNEKDRQSSRRSKSLSTPENKVDISLNSTRISRASRSISRLKDSNLLLIETDDPDESPKSSRRVSSASKKSSSVVERPSISFANTTSREREQENGVVTPENIESPEEARTPVLSIQSLLDSSRNSSFSKSLTKRGRPSLKRKTIGALSEQNKVRVSTKSKSMNIFLRTNRSRLSDDSYENLNITSRTDEEVVTPKSGVKLVPEAVKNKHSTAKKPQSKRSIIDDLNESDIVKQLFNSPVKRKLSQSMIEFSKNQLFDEDFVQIRRPTRNTIAMAGVTPDNSLIERTENFSPERFVSPISTPSNSPNLYGIKLMFGKNTPDNDLRDVRGVKALLRTPSARKSIKNDLTNVSGVKKMFSKNPKNRLSDVRVKEIFAPSPNNDLRRVSGVKRLFQSQKARKSPRNSLGDVRGVKALFNRKSPVNDLRNVSGVKRTIRKSPKNDLRDVTGVKNIFARNKNELDDLSGVEELFNVEEWLQTTPEKSKNNAQNRGLQKLVTHTLEATSPLVPRRVRNSTIVRNSIVEVTSMPKSASELYSTRKLPIKKRSLINASVEKSKENSKSNYLPIKKRAYDLLHSTPVKGRQGNMTMNASELGRVSPIAPDNTIREENEKTANLSTAASSRNSKIKPSPKNASGKLNVLPKNDKFTRNSKSKSANHTKVVSPIKPDTLVIASPKTTRSRKPVALLSEQRTASTNKNQESRNNDKVIYNPKTPKRSRAKVQKATVVVMKPSPQIKPRVTRGRNQESQTEVKQTLAKTKNVSPAKQKKRASLVVVKKSLVNRPSVTRKSKQSEDLATSARKTRANRSKAQNVVEKPITPRNKRVQKGTDVVTKPSPQRKTRATRAKAEVSQTVVKGKKVSPKESSPEDLPKTRGRKAVANNVSKQNSSLVEESETKSKRGRKQTNKQVSMQEDANTKVSIKTRRANQEVIPESSKTKTGRVYKQQSAEQAPKSTTRKANKQEVGANTTTARSRTRKSPDRTQPELSTRSRRTNKANSTVIPASNNRKRKSIDVDDRPTKVSKRNESRGKNKKPESPKAVASSKKPVVKKQGSGDAPSKAAKSKKADGLVRSVESKKAASPRSTRGRKAAVIAEPAQRKRKNQLEVVEEKGKKKARGGKTPVKVVQSPKQRTRTTRAAVTAEVSNPSGRSRRR